MKSEFEGSILGMEIEIPNPENLEKIVTEMRGLILPYERSIFVSLDKFFLAYSHPRIDPLSNKG